uniref:Uncharacterized protein n=1 Tax=Daphnia galeata TaxID=27404 RepID=A0A8J2RGX2_9CRUS|nr:unnamed protein product [Daphnia galeata]
MQDLKDIVVHDTRFGFTFEVTEGGFWEIDSNIVVPNGHTIEYGEQVGNGKSAFKANMDELCDCYDSKIFMFTKVDVGEPTAVIHIEAANGNNPKLEEITNRLSGALRKMKHEQYFMNLR